MAKEDFVKFYQEYLPTQPILQKKIDAIAKEDVFAEAVLEAGPAAGFKFTKSDVEAVMKASEIKVRGAELSEKQLDTVAGGAGLAIAAPTVQIRSLDSLSNLQSRPVIPDLGSKMQSTVMCCW